MKKKMIKLAYRKINIKWKAKAKIVRKKKKKKRYIHKLLIILANIKRYKDMHQTYILIQ